VEEETSSSGRQELFSQRQKETQAELPENKMAKKRNSTRERRVSQFLKSGLLL
jgi:hypothetical protein